MAKGPLGFSRPFVKEKIVFNPEEMKLYYVVVGPLERARPFAKASRIFGDEEFTAVSEDRVNECIISTGGENFGVKSVRADLASVLNVDEPARLGIFDYEDLPEQLREEAVNRARDWCRGLLEATERDDLSTEEVNERLDQLLDELDPEEGEEVDIDIEDVEDVDEEDLDDPIVPDVLE